MKKLYFIFLLGEYILLSIIFTSSLYEVYGLNHIGDTKLFGYKIENATSEILGNVYDYLDKSDAYIQIIKMPLSKDDVDAIKYEIYHTEPSRIHKFQGLSNTQYSYYMLSKEDFMDSTGVFYTNLSSKQIQKMADKLSIKIDNYELNSYTSIKTILYANGIDILVLLFMSYIVMLIYVVSGSKENAVKYLLGYSRINIVLSRVRETFLIELIYTAFIVFVKIIQYGLAMKLSLFYVMFLLGFLLLISCINIGMLFMTCMGLRKINVNSALKNQRYSHRLDNIIQIGKITMFLLVTVAISTDVSYYYKVYNLKKQIDNYRELNNFYSSYGFNSDEYEKISNDNKLYLKTAKQVKRMYRENINQAYIMQDCVLSPLDEGMNYEEFYGMSIEELFKSYKSNYIIVNEKYLEKYIDCKIESGKIDNSKYTLIVPLMYKTEEKELKNYYKLVLEDKMSADNYYGDETSMTIKEDDINVVYVDDNYSVELLSDYQYKSAMDIEIKHPVIIIDTGNFASVMYMDMLSNCQLAYNEIDKSEFSSMLIKYGLEKLFSARTMLAPFMEEINSYQFVLQQSELFVALFVLTLLFLIFISNHVHIYVYAKKFGIKYQLGFSDLRSLRTDIIVNGIMIVFSLVLKMFNLNIYGYLIFVFLDLMILYVLYRINIVNNLYKILNGGF